MCPNLAALVPSLQPSRPTGFKHKILVFTDAKQRRCGESRCSHRESPFTKIRLDRSAQSRLPSALEARVVRFLTDDAFIISFALRQKDQVYRTKRKAPESSCTLTADHFHVVGNLGLHSVIRSSRHVCICVRGCTRTRL